MSCIFQNLFRCKNLYDKEGENKSLNCIIIKREIHLEIWQTIILYVQDDNNVNVLQSEPLNSLFKNKKND